VSGEKPLVSFIIPCFNQAGFLHETISSVMLSYSGPKEILVIDDCSTKAANAAGLKEVKQTFPEVQLIYNEQNRGLSATRNRGISIAAGDYIQFLDSDDLLLPGKVDYQVEHFRLGNHIDISVTDFYFGDEILAEFKTMDPCIGSFNLTLEDFLYTWERGLSIPIHCALFRKELLVDTNFDETLEAKEDWVFWCKQAYLKRKISYLNKPGVIYRLHSAAMTKSKHAKMGKMWLKASFLINDFVRNQDNSFLNKSLAWYESHYSHLADIREEESSKVYECVAPSDGSQSTTENAETVVTEPATKAVPRTFSIIIPVYNHFEYLEKCFESLTAQRFSDFEIICIDDHSPDPRVKEHLKLLAFEHPNVIIHSNPVNQGIAASINTGIRLASGNYLAFVDCDDYLDLGALDEVKGYIQKHPDVDYFFTDKIDVDEGGNFIREAVYGGYASIQPSGDIEDDLLDGMVASHLKVIKRETAVKLGGCDPAMNGVQDYDLALRISGNGKFKYIHKPLYFHRQHGSSVTLSQTVSQFRKMNIARRKYLERMFPQKRNPAEGLAYVRECVTTGAEYSAAMVAGKGIALFTPADISLKALKAQVKAGNTCVFDARGEYTQELKYFIREYNSYLDLIIINDPRLSAAIMGVLWNLSILWEPLFLSANPG
jgi:glycosyltransferase involved in cell wall biosynthesis